MKAHLSIDFRAVGMEVVHIPPFAAKYPLLFSKVIPAYYKCMQCAAIVQEHDAIDAYVLTVEIRTDIPLSIPINTGIPDLYWLYQPVGESRFSLHGLPEQTSLLLPEQHCCQAYSMPFDVLWQTHSEKLFLQVHIIKGKWAARYAFPKNRALELLIRCKRDERLCTFVTSAAAIAPAVDQYLAKVRLVSPSEGMGLDGDLQKPISHLADWHRGIYPSGTYPLPQESTLLNPDKAFVNEIQQKVWEWLRLDIPIIPTVEQIAKKWHVSTHYLWQRYEKGKGDNKETLKQFIIRAKVTEAKRLMEEEGYTVDEVWTHLGYTDYRSFRRHFLKIFGMTPINFRKQSRGNRF